MMSVEVSKETVHTFRQSDAVEYRFVSTPAGEGILGEWQQWDKEDITVGAGRLCVECTPAMPDHPLTTQELEAYCKARHEMLGRLASVVGAAVVVAET